MKLGALLFRITTIVVFLQLLLGGLLTFDFINAGAHILAGLIIFILSVATMIVSLVSKPKSRPLQMTSVALVTLVIVQIILGFDTLDTGSQVIALIHFVNAMAIYGVAMSGTFVASRWVQATKVRPTETS
ncbi:MAG: hypothetical protein JRN15_06400 [Nitrososphaerota archaeon]|nr:hypothetical protein [Nitrososphaerota archaeon]